MKGIADLIVLVLLVLLVVWRCFWYHDLWYFLRRRWFAAVAQCAAVLLHPERKSILVQMARCCPS